MGQTGGKVEMDTESDAKLAELILYIAGRCLGDETFDDAKLKEILFACDFGAYAHFGKSITGAEYVADGPPPSGPKGSVTA